MLWKAYKHHILIHTLSFAGGMRKACLLPQSSPPLLVFAACVILFPLIFLFFSYWFTYKYVSLRHRVTTGPVWPDSVMLGGSDTLKRGLWLLVGCCSCGPARLKESAPCAPSYCISQQPINECNFQAYGVLVLLGVHQ